MEAQPLVIDVQEQDFQQAVMVRSQEVPVLVDFWATWCGPCRTLGPILEKVVASMQGRVILAKVDADENPRLAQMLQIQSLPTVMLFIDGRPVDGFLGAKDEKAVREFLAKHIQSTADDLLAHAQALLDEGDWQGAHDTLRDLLAADEVDPKARLLMARVAVATGDEALLRTQVDALPAGSAEQRQGEQLLESLAFQASCGPGEAAHRAALEANEQDVAARYGLGCCLAAQGQYESALAELLAAVRLDKGWQDQAARKAMVTIFGILGPGSDLAGDYRRQLVIYL